MTATQTSGGRPAPHDVFAALPRVDRHKPKGPPLRKSKVSRWRAAVLIGVHVLIGLHIWHWLAAGETLTPVEPSEAMQTVEEGRINAGFVLFSFLIVSTLVVGRFFCGWACHLVALQDLSAWLLGKFGLKPRPVRSRLLVFGPWAVGGYMFVWPVVEHWLWPDQKKLPAVGDWNLQLTTSELWRTFPGPIMTIASVVVVGGLIVWWLGAKGFCTFGCPYGAFFTIADRFAPVRIKVDPTKCEHCGHCTQACTSNVRVHEEVAKYHKVVDPGCMKCLDCVSVCPKDALSVGFAAPKPFAISQQRIQARSDFRWWEEVVLAATALVAVQWGFRGAWFVEQIPFLLSVGIGAITAVLVLLLLRLLTHRDVTFQHTVLKVGGSLRRAGWIALLALVGWVAFAAHTGVANARCRAADLAMGRADASLRAALYGDPRTVDLSPLPPAIAAIEVAQGTLWFRLGLWAEWRALALRAMGQHREAEQALLDELGDGDALRLVEANLALASYAMDPARQRFEQARRLVDAALRRVPDHPVGLMLKERLEQLGK